MTAYEERQQLMQQAAALQAELQALRAAFTTITIPVGEVIARLVSNADSLLIPAADEVSAGRKTKVSKITPEEEVPVVKPIVRAKGKRKPLSAERKAQLRETLKKARAARGKKKHA